MRVALIGNFEPEFSTENEIRDAMGRLGWEVLPVQSGDVAAFTMLIGDLRVQAHDLDFIMWIRTADLWAKWGTEAQWTLLAEARRRDIPVVGYHLDRWWGLRRESEVLAQKEPFFYSDLLVTADGGHPEMWEGVGVEHHWMPPGVSERWCQPGEFQEELATDIVFVGSWQGGYHREWGHRPALVQWLQNNYGDRVRFYPIQGQPAVRGLALNDVYWSAKVVVGDSCLVPKSDGSPMTHYCSDRVPETLGRGGILLHPSVEGIDDVFPYDPWPLDDWDCLALGLDLLVGGSPDAFAYRMQMIEHVKAHHTYTRRMEQLQEVMVQKGLL